MHERVALDVHLKAPLLDTRWELAMQQQVTGVGPVTLFRQLLDGVATVEQHALVAVDEGDGRLTGGRGGEARIKGADARPVGRPMCAIVLIFFVRTLAAACGCR